MRMAEATDRTVRKGPIAGLVDTFRHSLDEKKRLTIPSEWRDALGKLKDDALLMRDIFASFDADDDPPDADEAPDKWGDDQWRD